MSELKDRIVSDMTAAMKAREKDKVAALRMLKAAIMTEEVSGEKHELTDEQVLFLTDIFPTGYQAAENCNIIPGRDVVAVFGTGPVGQFAIRSAYMLGAAHVIAKAISWARSPVAGWQCGWRGAARACAG